MSTAKANSAGSNRLRHERLRVAAECGATSAAAQADGLKLVVVFWVPFVVVFWRFWLN